jgi:hypothetical protein
LVIARSVVDGPLNSEVAPVVQAAVRQRVAVMRSVAALTPVMVQLLGTEALGLATMHEPNQA